MEVNQRIYYPNGDSHIAVLVKCDCGKTLLTRPDTLVRGRQVSCGCLTGYLNRARAVHGLHSHPLYKVWYHAVQRCHNSSHRLFPLYGARGILVCEKWHDLRTFISDVEAEIGSRPDDRYPSGRIMYTLDRIDNDRGYEPGNIRWADMKMQASNRRRGGWYASYPD